MKKRLNASLASRTGAAALALTFVASNATQAVAFCAAPHEMAALRVAALRQHLMVAALNCHKAAYFNRFVTAYRDEFQTSDHDLMQFFVRQGSGENGYNAYKTKEANDSSLRSLNDPEFCGGAEAAFYIALHNSLPLAELAKEEAPMLHVGFAGCTRSADADMDASFASPALPARHGAMMEAAVAPPAAAATAPALAAAPVAAPAPTQVAALPPAPEAAAAPAQEEDDAVANDTPPPAQAAYNYNNYNPYQARGGYQTAYNAPSYPYNPYYSNAWYPYNPPQMRQVQGPDGRWYLVPSYVR